MPCPRFLFMMLLGALLGGCAGEDDAPTEPVSGEAVSDPVVALPQAPGQAVARVGESGVITDAQVDAAIARMPEGTSREEALGALIELELIAQEAQRRGLDTRPEAVRVQERAIVQRFLEQTIERDAPATTDDELRGYYDQILLDIPGLRPELITVSHVLVYTAPEGEALAEEIRTRMIAEEVLSEEVLERIALEANMRGPRVRVEHTVKFPRIVPVPTDGGPPRYSQMVESFAEASFALTPEQPISPVTQTPYGHHVIVLRHREPAQRAPFDRLHAALLDVVNQAKRQSYFEQGLRALFQEAEIRVDDEALTALAERLFSQDPAQQPKP